eukprot:SAG31_NODE_3716_length_3953_cov_1.724961_4_plen_67_part_00
MRAMSAAGGDMSRLNVPSGAELKTMMARMAVPMQTRGADAADPRTLQFLAMVRSAEEAYGKENIYK